MCYLSAPTLVMEKLGTRNFLYHIGSVLTYIPFRFDRRFRVYDVSEFGETIKTYKRTEKGEIMDEMVLAGKGAPSPYEGS